MLNFRVPIHSILSFLSVGLGLPIDVRKHIFEIKQMNGKMFLMVIMSSYLTSCASVPNTYNPQINAQDLRSNYASLLSADWDMEIALLNKKSMSQRDITEKENKIRSIANEKCLVPYENKLTKTLNIQKIKEQPNQDKKITIYKASLNQAYQESIKLDAALPNCLKPLGVSGQIRVNHGGHYYSTPQYLQIVIARTDQLTSINSKQNNNPNIAQDFLGTWANIMSSELGSMAYSGANNNQYYVQPYYRDDGTYVRGHYKTTPNNYCSDNIRGCR